MSARTLSGTRPEPAGTQPTAGTTEAAAAEKLPRPPADPQDDWPLDVHLPDEREDEDC